MSIEQDRKIVRLFHELRRLEKAGRPTAGIRQQIREAMQEREAACAGQISVTSLVLRSQPG